MFWGRCGLIVMTAVAASGCAGVQAQQELARLQSQVGMLDERVTQLERTSGGGMSSGSFGATSGFSDVVTSGLSETEKPARVSTAAATVSSGRYSTREIQQALKNAGFYQGAVDGKMGPRTREAVKEFQRVHGLTDDGVVGKQTWVKLKAYAELSSADAVK